MLNIKNILSDLPFIEVKIPLPQVGYKNYEYSVTEDSILIDNGIMDFIINTDGYLLLGNGHYKLNKRKHTLIFAGKIGFENGKITYIDNDSGHYSPSHKDLDDIYNVMKKAGIISKCAEKKYF